MKTVYETRSEYQVIKNRHAIESRDLWEKQKVEMQELQDNCEHIFEWLDRDEEKCVGCRMTRTDYARKRVAKSDNLVNTAREAAR